MNDFNMNSLGLQKKVSSLSILQFKNKRTHPQFQSYTDYQFEVSDYNRIADGLVL